MKKISFLLALLFAALPGYTQQKDAAVPAQNDGDYYTGYEGTVLGGENKTDIYRGEVFGENKKNYQGDVLDKKTDNKKVYRGEVFGEKKKAYQGDIVGKEAPSADMYRGTVFGEQPTSYPGKKLGNKPRPKTKWVYDTTLIRAIKAQDLDSVKTLLYANVNTNEKNYAGITPLTVAAERGDMKIIKLLVETGNAKINEPSSYGVTPLLAAAAAGKQPAVAYLVANGADVLAKDDLGKTALIHAAAHDDAKLIKDLISSNKQAVNLPDGLGNTPLMYAAQNGNLRTIQVLLDNHAFVTTENPVNGVTALALAAGSKQPNAIKVLSNAGANISATDAKGRTPLFYAAAANDLDSYRLLKKMGNDSNALDLTGKTILMTAAEMKAGDIAYEVLWDEVKPDVNATDNSGKTALMYAAQKDQSITRMLLDTGADTDLLDENGDNALLLAVSAKNEPAALALIKAGADLYQANKNSNTVFSLTDKNLPKSTLAQVLANKRDGYEERIKPAPGASYTNPSAQLQASPQIVNEINKDPEVAALQQQLDNLKQKKLQQKNSAAVEKSEVMPVQILTASTGNTVKAKPAAKKARPVKKIVVKRKTTPAPVGTLADQPELTPPPQMYTLTPAQHNAQPVQEPLSYTETM